MRLGIGERRNQRALPALVIACNSSFNAKEESGGEHKESGLRSSSPLSFWEAEVQLRGRGPQENPCKCKYYTRQVMAPRSPAPSSLPAATTLKLTAGGNLDERGKSQSSFGEAERGTESSISGTFAGHVLREGG